MKETVKEFKKKSKLDKEIREINTKLEKELDFIIKGTMFELGEYIKDKFMKGASSVNSINDKIEYERYIVIYIEIRRTMYDITSKLLNNMQESVDKYSVELGNRIRETIKDR